MAYEDAVRQLHRRRTLEASMGGMGQLREQARQEREFAEQVVAAYAGKALSEVAQDVTEMGARWD